jgi:hypothetical protein
MQSRVFHSSNILFIVPYTPNGAGNLLSSWPAGKQIPRPAASE